MSTLNIKPLVPGLALVTGIAIVASIAGHAFPLIGGAVFGILIGIVLRCWVQPGEQYNEGIRFSSKKVLQWSIIMLGFCLPFTQVMKTGMTSLTVTAYTIATAFISAVVFGRLLKVPLKLSVLIGTGTAICGGSAIAAITPVVKPDEHELAYSMSTIFLFNIAAVLIFPIFGRMLGLSDTGFGMWAGTAINDTSSVVAAGYAWSKHAGDYATIVKLTRAMLIIPVTLLIGLAFGLIEHRKNNGTTNRSALRKAVPMFIVWFVVASMVGSYLPEWFITMAHAVAPFLITMALTAIGLTTDLGKMCQTGMRPVLLGMLIWISVASSSLIVQYFHSHW